MNVRLSSFGPLSLVDLATEPAFLLGQAEVTPSLLRLRCGTAQATLEPRVMQVLTVLARRPGEVVSRDELVATCWSGRFVSEDAIQRTIAKLRRHAQAEVAGAFGIETVPRVGYRLVLGAEGSGATPGTLPRRSWWRVGVTTAILAALIAGGVLAWRRLATPLVPATVTLSDFKALGPGVPADLPASFAETLRDAFGEDNDLALTSHGGDFVLHGVVQRVGDNLRYSVRLDDAERHALVWAASPELPAADAYAPRRVAVVMSEVVRCGLIGAAEYPGRLPTHTLGLYLQYCNAGQGIQGNLERGLALARRAVAETPDFARGWSAVARAAAVLSMSAAPPQKAAYVEEVHKAAARALQLDPRNGEAWEVQTYILPGNAYLQREALLRHAVAGHLSGCGCEVSAMGGLLNSVGRTREALSYYRRAYDRQPLHGPATLGLFITYDALGRWQEAEEISSRSAQLRGPDRGPWTALHASYRGDWSGAKYVTDRVAPPPLRPGLAAAFDALSSGDPGRIAAARPAVEAAAKAQPQSVLLTETLVTMGAVDAAFRSLGVMADRGLTGTLFRPRQLTLSHDPRYAALMERSGLIAYWRQSRTRPDLCGDANPPPFCATLTSGPTAGR